MILKDFKRGFKYQAWIGYQWIICEYPKTGFFGKQQIQLAIDKGIVKPL